MTAGRGCYTRAMIEARFAPVALLLVIAARALAGPEISSIPEIGPHYRVVTIEKSVNPRNKLVAYTRLDEKCRVVRDPKQGGRPVFDFYWLMDGTRYKRVHPLIKRGIRKRLEVAASPPKSRDGAFSVRLNELDAVEHDLGASPLFWIRAEKKGAGCSAEARITLGPSNKNAVIRLDTIYSEADLKGRFSAKVKTIALKGADVRTGKPLVRVYRAK
jgi:hypothetical protein